jgi:hypothetical protein
MAGLNADQWLSTVVLGKAGVTELRWKIATLAKGSPSGIYLVGTILEKPTYPDIQSNEIAGCKLRSRQKRQRFANRNAAMRAMWA